MGVTEVRARLRVEDGASPALDKAKAGFKGVAGEAKAAGQGALSFVHQAMATAMAMQAVPLALGVKDFAKSWVDAGKNAQAADQAVAGFIATSQGLPWDEAKSQAQNYGDTLDEISLKTMQLGDDVSKAFNAFIEVGGASKKGLEDAVKQTEQMATVANVLGKSAEGLAREYAFMGEGVLKTKGQLFQLLQPTGIFGKDTKKAAEYWSKITDESRTKLLAYGLEQVSSRLGQATPILADYENALSNLWTMTKEKLGEPIAKAIEPALKDVIARWKEAIPTFDRLGVKIGRDVGEWVNRSTRSFENGILYLRDHHAEIAKDIKDAFAQAKSVVEWILSNKEMIAYAFGAKAAAPAIGAGANLLEKVAGYGKSGVGALGIAGGAGAAASMAAFVAAVAAFGLAVDQFRKLDNEGGLKSDARKSQDAREEALRKMALDPQLTASSADAIKRFEDLRRSFVAGAVALGDDGRAAGALADAAWKAHQEARRLVGPVDQAAKMMDAFAASRAKGMIPDDQSIAQVDAMVAQVSASFAAAYAAQNGAQQQYIAQVMTKSQGLRDAFIAGGQLTAEGFEALSKLVEGSSKEFADALKGRAAEQSKGASGPAAPKVVMTGGQTFNVKQDFRDQDPDRVAIVFEEGIGRLVERRIGSSASTPFGT